MALTDEYDVPEQDPASWALQPGSIKLKPPRK